MPSQRSLRFLFAALVLLSAATVGSGLVAASVNTTLESHLDGDVKTNGATIAPPSDGITVIATDSNQWQSQSSEQPRATAQLVALTPNGSALYYNDSHDRYWDVDPVRRTSTTVEYMYSDHLEGDECPTEWDYERYNVSAERWTRYERVRNSDACTRNGVERVNLRTGEVTRVWSQVTPGKEATRYHDADRLDDDHLVVADIYFDRVFVVNVTTGHIEWTWNASDVFPTATGGPYPDDWSHINDVEALDDGRIMVSLRNQDQVAFLDRNGIVQNWTLGAENDYGRLYEQHNPDFLPPRAGGPAVVVADSENNRIVEYQRDGDRWNRTWLWRDARMQWPRDADRLPNGHTLITDSNGNRVFEVDERGKVVWSVDVAFPYEAERLDTGDESTNGPSARQADLRSRAPRSGEQLLIHLKGLLPGKFLNGLMYVTPVWMGFVELLALAMGLVVGVVWGGFELRWALADRRSLNSRLPWP